MLPSFAAVAFFCLPNSTSQLHVPSEIDGMSVLLSFMTILMMRTQHQRRSWACAGLAVRKMKVRINLMRNFVIETLQYVCSIVIGDFHQITAENPTLIMWGFSRCILVVVREFFVHISLSTATPFQGYMVARSLGCNRIITNKRYSSLRAASNTRLLAIYTDRVLVV